MLLLNGADRLCRRDTEKPRRTPEKKEISRAVAYGPFVCAVHSGGKSLHGWFNVEGEDEEKANGFFLYAVSLGADPATWTRSQFVS
jgi:hypothetical protein